MRVVVSGASGFLGSNLCFSLNNISRLENPITVLEVTRHTSESELYLMLRDADFLFHLAGANRPSDPIGFVKDNINITQTIADSLSKANNRCPIVFSSSIHAEGTTEYGLSKKMAESILIDLSSTNGNPVVILRLPGVFGKWCRPNYNNVIATWCYNIQRGRPIEIDDLNKHIKIAYIDDVVGRLVEFLDHFPSSTYCSVDPVYNCTLEEIYSLLQRFHLDRSELRAGNIGSGLERVLYATFLSYLPLQEAITVTKVQHDHRGSFVEFIKTQKSGQFSLLTINPSEVRGSHFHNTKNERFLVISGTVEFKFLDIRNNQSYLIRADSSDGKIVETIPGVAHLIKNVGADVAVLGVYANEVFDPAKPDTYFQPMVD